MPTRPTTTLLVSTYEWPRALELVLRSALAQRALPDEVVIADDGSGDETRALVRDFAARFAAAGVPLVHAWQEDRGFRKARILNDALTRARGDYVCMTDGDCVLHPAFIASHAAFARAGSFVQGSRVLVRPERTARALERGDVRFAWSDAGLKNRANALHLPLLTPLVRVAQEAVQGTRGCNLAFWRADAERVNGFDERYEGWGREDSDFAARLLNAGVRRRKLKFAGVVYHLWHPEQPRVAVPEQERVLADVIARRVAWCERGMDGHRTSEERRRTATANADGEPQRRGTAADGVDAVGER